MQSVSVGDLCARALQNRCSDCGTEKLMSAPVIIASELVPFICAFRVRLILTTVSFVQPLQARIEQRRLAATSGDVDQQHKLAVLLMEGTDAQKAESFELLNVLAGRNHAKSLHALAVCYHRGIGVRPDASKARQCLLQAAKLGNAQAMFGVGESYYFWRDRDEAKALEWYTKAANANCVDAQYRLACFYRDGIAAVADLRASFELFSKAAAAGEPRAQLQLARCFANGWGTEKHIGNALEWLAKAEAAGQKAAAVERLYLQTDAASQKLFERWKTLHPATRRPTVITAGHLIAPFRLLRASTFGQAIVCTEVTHSGPREVVVKVPKSQTISDAWLNEMLALAALPHHDNVLKLIGICAEFECTNSMGLKLKPSLSIVTEFAAQGSIVDYFSRKENEGDSAKFLLPWALDIARGLAHLHKHGCLHRDLAARNVFIDQDNRAIIGDLGLARPLDQADGVFKSEHKSPAYPLDVAPQVLQREEYSAASDVFNVGLTMFEIATECKFADTFAFSQSSLSVQAAKIEQLAAKGYPALVSKLPSTTPAAMVDLMLRCLAFDDTKRPTAAELVTRLEELASETGAPSISAAAVRVQQTRGHAHPIAMRVPGVPERMQLSKGMRRLVFQGRQLEREREQ